MLVLHAAVFANGQTLASRLEFLLTCVRLLAGLQAFGGGFVRSGHGAVTLDVLFDFLVGMLLRPCGGGQECAAQQGQGGGPAPQGAGTNNQNNDQAAPQGPAAPTEAARQAPAPVPADNLCTDQSLSVVLYTDKATYKVGDQPVFTIAVTNGGLTECVRDIGKSAQNVVVRSLDGTRTLWSARDCSPLRTVKNVTFAPGQQERDTITWSGTTSTPGCKTPREPVPPGAYRAVGKIGERESAPITFNVVAPAQQP